MNRNEIKKDIQALSDEDLTHNWKVFLVKKKSTKGEEREKVDYIFDEIEKEQKKRYK